MTSPYPCPSNSNQAVPLNGANLSSCPQTFVRKLLCEPPPCDPRQRCHRSRRRRRHRSPVLRGCSSAAPGSKAKARLEERSRGIREKAPWMLFDAASTCRADKLSCPCLYKGNLKILLCPNKEANKNSVQSFTSPTRQKMGSNSKKGLNESANELDTDFGMRPRAGSHGFKHRHQKTIEVQHMEHKIEILYDKSASIRFLVCSVQKAAFWCTLSSEWLIGILVALVQFLSSNSTVYGRLRFICRARQKRKKNTCAKK